MENKITVYFLSLRGFSKPTFIIALQHYCGTGASQQKV